MPTRPKIAGREAPRLSLDPPLRTGDVSGHGIEMTS
jgi:hypothetical protein